MQKSISRFREECRNRWRNGNFIENGKAAVAYSPNKKLEWIPYESYMRAQIVKGEPDAIGVLIVEFPAEVGEDNEHHCHPKSDRCITVIGGSGTFEYFKGRELFVEQLTPGDRVWMPRGVLHTFRSGKEGLLVESLHSPFLPLGHPHCIVYPRKFDGSDSKAFRPEVDSAESVLNG
ncbi:MAG TPA: cupin domain-containing protein [Leptolyngbyaceae cyanobacterium]